MIKKKTVNDHEAFISYHVLTFTGMGAMSAQVNESCYLTLLT